MTQRHTYWLAWRHPSWVEQSGSGSPHYIWRNEPHRTQAERDAALKRVQAAGNIVSKRYRNTDQER